MRILGVGMALLMGIGLFGASQSLIIKLGATEDIRDLKGDFEITDIEQIQGRPIFRIEITSNMATQALVNEIYSNANVELVEVNQRSRVISDLSAAVIDARPIMVLDARPIMVLDDDQRRTSESSAEADPLYDQPFISQIGVKEALQVSTGAGVRIAVLDTGVDMDHPFLVGNIHSHGFDFVDEDSWPDEVQAGVDSSGNGVDDEGWGHGTHVAGIIAMVAPGAEIMPIRVIDSDGTGDLFNVLQGLDYAASHGARIINMSFSIGQPSALLSERIYELRREQIFVVTSAGNYSSSELGFPSNEWTTLSVASVDSSDQLSSFSNYGNRVDVLAPGENILSCHPGGSNFIERSGTSMAAPMAAALAALLIEKRPQVRNPVLRFRIRNKSRDVSDLNDQPCGRGVIDLPASLGIK